MSGWHHISTLPATGIVEVLTSTGLVRQAQWYNRSARLILMRGHWIRWVKAKDRNTVYSARKWRPIDV